MSAGLRSATSDTFRSLRTRNFRLFFSGQLISQTGTWLTMITQTLLVLKLTNSGIALGLLTACLFGPMLLLGPWAGAVADRADKRTLLTTTQILAMVQSLALGVVVLGGWASIPAIYALAAVQGFITAFDNPARRSFVVEMVPSEDLANAVSLNSAVMTGSRVVGPAVAGALVLVLGYGWPFVLDSVSYIAVIAGLLMMRPDELYRAVRTPKGKGQVRAGLRYIRSEPQLMVPLIMTAVIGTFAFNFSVTVPLMVERALGGGTSMFTFVFSVLSLGSLVGALWTARRKEVTGHQLVVAAVAFGIAMLLFAAAPNLGLVFPAAILLGLTSITFMTSSTSIVQLVAGPEYRGRVLAIQAMVFLGSTPIGGPIIGWLSDVAGARAGLVAGGVACLVAAAYGARAFDIGRRRPVDPESETIAEARAEADYALAD